MTVEHIKGWLGGKVFGLTMYVDLVDACGFGCPTCPVGVQKRRDGHRMGLDVFRAILDKAESECRIRKIQLYRWSDPLLHPALHEFVGECRRRGIRCAVSSALKSWQCDIGKVIEARPDEFRVSFSGWRSLHRYQKGNTVQRFLKNFEEVASLPRYPETKWVMYFHQYKDNLDETQEARELAEANGMKFVAFPATFMVYDNIIEGYSYDDEETLEMLTERPEENILRLRKKPSVHDYCNMQEKEITLDSYGRMQLCQLMFKQKYQMGDFLSEPLKDIRKRIMEHPLCGKCKAMGVGKYSLIFADPVVVEKPVEKANEGKYVSTYINQMG